jgi:hypothetical protein
MWENSYMTYLIKSYLLFKLKFYSVETRSSCAPLLTATASGMAIVDYVKMVGGRLGGGWLGVRVMVCATDSWVSLSARISLSAGSQIRLFSQISLF